MKGRFSSSFEDRISRLSVNGICSGDRLSFHVWNERRTQEINTSAHGLEILGSACACAWMCMYAWAWKRRKEDGENFWFDKPISREKSRRSNFLTLETRRERSVLRSLSCSIILCISCTYYACFTSAQTMNVFVRNQQVGTGNTLWKRKRKRKKRAGLYRYEYFIFR